MGHPGAEATRPDHAVIDPIINDLVARAKPFGYLSDCELFRPLELRRWNPMLAADPLDYLRRVAQSFRAGPSFPIELICNFTIGQVARQFSNLVNHRGR